MRGGRLAVRGLHGWVDGHALPQSENKRKRPTAPSRDATHRGWGCIFQGFLKRRCTQSAHGWLHATRVAVGMHVNNRNRNACHETSDCMGKVWNAFASTAHAHSWFRYNTFNRKLQEFWPAVFSLHRITRERVGCDCDYVHDCDSPPLIRFFLMKRALFKTQLLNIFNTLL